MRFKNNTVKCRVPVHGVARVECALNAERVARAVLVLQVLRGAEAAQLAGDHDANASAESVCKRRVRTRSVCVRVCVCV